MCFRIFTDITKSEPEDSESPVLVAPSPSTIERLKLPDALGVRPNFTETLGMLSNFDSDIPSNILKDDPDDLSNAPLDLEAIIEEPLAIKEEPDADVAQTPMPIVSSEAKKIKTTSTTKVTTASSPGQKKKTERFISNCTGGKSNNKETSRQRRFRTAYCSGTHRIWNRTVIRMTVSVTARIATRIYPGATT